MTTAEAERAIARLKAYYPTAKAFDELTTTVYMEELIQIRWDDFCAGAKEVVRTSKFFPSIAELMEAADAAARKRFDIQEHDEREERLAIKGEDRIMDPKSDVHRVVVGPQHQIFLDYLSGKRTFPEPEWMKRKSAQLQREGRA